MNGRERHTDLPPPDSGEDNECTIPLQDDPEAEKINPEFLRGELNFRRICRIADFEEWHTIGMGGMGMVCEVRERGLNRRIAVKLLRPQYRQNRKSIQRFVTEAKITAQIGHPNIVPVYQIGVLDDAGVYFTMKRVEGITLRTLLANLENDVPGFRRRYTLNRLLEIFCAACNGVAAAHRAGFIHCDLKPGNLMIGEFGEVMVMDWGIARRSGEEFFDERGDAVPPAGTPLYMAPEHVSREINEPDQLTDVYGLGTILYSILTWKSALFDAGLPQEKLLPLVAAGRFIPLRTAAKVRPIPQELAAICCRALERDRNKRYPSVGALLEDVRNYMNNYPVDAYSPNFWYRCWKRIIRHPLIPVAIAAGLLTAAGYFFFSAIVEDRKEESLQMLAAYHYARGEEDLRLMQRRLRRSGLHDLPEDPNAAAATEIRLMNALLDTSNSFSAVLNLLSQLSDAKQDAWCIRTSADIFKHLLQAYLSQGNLPMAERLLIKGRSQWRGLLTKALGADPELATLVRRLDSRLGVIGISGPDETNWNYWILRNGSPLSGKDGTPCPERKFSSSPHIQELPQGEYQLLCRNGEKTLLIPFSVSAGVIRHLRCPLPETISAGMAFIPAGEFLLARSNTLLRPIVRRTGSFLISRREVTFGEYLEFWRSLPGEKRKEYTLRLINPGGQPRPLWDEEGRLLPGLSPDLPLFASGLKEAQAYCRWLSEKTGRRVRLPGRAEWEKAFRGTDGRLYPWGNQYRCGHALLRDSAARYPAGAPGGTFSGDVSPYGVQDLCGSVRELLEPLPQEPSERAIGGSRLTSQFHLAPENVIPGSPDVGFRYVMEL